MDRPEGPPPAALEPLGLTSGEEAIYGALLEHPGCTLQELAAVSLLSMRAVRQRLRGLERRGLVSSLPGDTRRLVPADPQSALEVLVLRRQEELEQIRLLAGRLGARYRRTAQRRDPTQVVEIIVGAQAVENQGVQLQRSAVREVCVIDRPPYVEARPGLNSVQMEVMAKGVVYRALYQRSALELPGRLDHLFQYLAAGEAARVIAEAPLKLAIFDRRIAVVPLNLDDETYSAMLLVHESPLLDALILGFEGLWDRGIPVTPGRPLPDEETPTAMVPSAQDRVLLALLAAGFKDAVIARHLGVGLRTVTRRIETLLDELAVESRFQAGLEAGRRGWL